MKDICKTMGQYTATEYRAVQAQYRVMSELGLSQWDPQNEQAVRNLNSLIAQQDTRLRPKTVSRPEQI